MAFDGEEGAWALGEGESGGGVGQSSSLWAHSSYWHYPRGPGAGVSLCLLSSFPAPRVNILSKGKLRELWAIQSLGNRAEKLGEEL